MMCEPITCEIGQYLRNYHIYYGEVYKECEDCTLNCAKCHDSTYCEECIDPAYNLTHHYYYSYCEDPCTAREYLTTYQTSEREFWNMHT